MLVLVLKPTGDFRRHSFYTRLRKLDPNPSSSSHLRPSSSSVPSVMVFVVLMVHRRRDATISMGNRSHLVLYFTRINVIRRAGFHRSFGCSGETGIDANIRSRNTRANSFPLLEHRRGRTNATDLAFPRRGIVFRSVSAHTQIICPTRLRPYPCNGFQSLSSILRASNLSRRKFETNKIGKKITMKF